MTDPTAPWGTQSLPPPPPQPWAAEKYPRKWKTWHMIVVGSLAFIIGIALAVAGQEQETAKVSPASDENVAQTVPVGAVATTKPVIPVTTPPVTSPPETSPPVALAPTVPAGTFTMPEVVGKNLQIASEQLEALGAKVIAHDTHEDRTVLLYTNWQVTTQDPAAGSTVVLPATIDLGAKKFAD